MNSHTEGPWQVGGVFDNDGEPEIVIEKVTPQGSLAIAVAIGGLSGQEANAYVLAAAPEMLQQIKELIRILPADHPAVKSALEVIDKAQPGLQSATLPH